MTSKRPYESWSLLAIIVKLVMASRAFAIALLLTAPDRPSNKDALTTVTMDALINSQLWEFSNNVVDVSPLNFAFQTYSSLSSKH